MIQRIIREKHLNQFKKHLENEEKSMLTIEKYMRDAKRFVLYADQQGVTKNW